MDVVPVGTGPAAGHRRFAVVRQVGAGAQIPDGFVHAGRKSGRRPFQERDIRGRPQSPVVDPGRRRFAGVAGESSLCYVLNFIKFDCGLESKFRIFFTFFLWKNIVRLGSDQSYEALEFYSAACFQVKKYSEK